MIWTFLLLALSWGRFSFTFISLITYIFHQGFSYILFIDNPALTGAKMVRQAFSVDLNKPLAFQVRFHMILQFSESLNLICLRCFIFFLFLVLMTGRPSWRSLWGMGSPTYSQQRNPTVFCKWGYWGIYIANPFIRGLHGLWLRRLRIYMFLHDFPCPILGCLELLNRTWSL